MRFFKKTNIDFLGVRRRWYLVSGLIILAGMTSLVVKGIDYGIDFRGGTEVIFSFSKKLEIADIRTALATVGLSKSEIKSYGTEGNMLIRTTEQAEGNIIGDRIRQAIQQSFPDVRFEVLKEDRIGPKIGEELRRDALYAVIDVLVTLGVLSLLDGLIPVNLEITQEVIAAFLTLVGVSVNDTVVVFDRIRENLKIYRSLSLAEVMNRSLNDTLSRTIITNGSILLVLIILLFFAGDSTRGFAFALTVGEITGTYSSIYIASAVVLDSSLRKKKPA